MSSGSFKDNVAYKLFVKKLYIYIYIYTALQIKSELAAGEKSSQQLTDLTGAGMKVETPAQKKAE